MVKQNSKVFLEENFLKRHETAVVDELDRGVRNKWDSSFYMMFHLCSNKHWRWTALFTWCFTCATTNTGDGLLFLHDVSLVQQQTLELVGNCMAYSLLLPILIRLHFKAICTSTTLPHIVWAEFLVYRHRTWEGNTGYALSCRPVNYTCM